MKVSTNLNKSNIEQFINSLRNSLRNFNYYEQGCIDNRLSGVSGTSSEARKEVSRDAKNKSKN